MGLAFDPDLNPLVSPDGKVTDAEWFAQPYPTFEAKFEGKAEDST